MKPLGNQNIHEKIPEFFAVIPTMDVVVFPHMIVPLLVIDEKIIKGINKALQESKMILLLAARDNIDKSKSIGTHDLYTLGTAASIMRIIKLPEGGIKILVQGVSKAIAHEIITQDDMLLSRAQLIEPTVTDPDSVIAQIRSLKNISEKLSLSGLGLSPDFHLILSKMNDPEKIADFILSHAHISVDDAQKLLEMEDMKDVLETLYCYLNKELELADIQERIKSHARESMNQAQKEFYLREQLRAIKNELGEDDDEEIEEMREKCADLPLTEEVRTEIMRHINRLERTSPDSLEATVTRNHLEWIFALPWGHATTDNLDINHAKQILDEDHFGINDIKDRILDFISIRNLKNDGTTPILCFVGPPGTGKTSLGKSIAKSLGRHYARISLGGVKDEAEIRGHRRTYVGAMPGRFIQALRKAGSTNPVMIIDELDKIGNDFRGDPSAAMLEVLDPHQNNSFYDNYLGIPFDLSRVMFIATANSIDTISGPLRDRMEIIELSGYTIEEKCTIAQRHLVEKSLYDSGMQAHNLHIPDSVIKAVIESYTRESGVRQLKQFIDKLCSKAARIMVEKKELVTFTPETIERYLGPRKFLDDDIALHDQIGISNGLAWTTHGGEMLKIEAVLMPGKGQLILTGSLGEVMKESAQAAVSYARSHAKQFGIDHAIFSTHDLHIHAPAGAIPKDGPSAGITMLTSILSAYTQRPISRNYAMTGELSLSGEVMPIGGVKEKILAAKRNGVPHVILPCKNKNDLIGLDDIINGIQIIWVQHANEVIEHVLQPLLQVK